MPLRAVQMVQSTPFQPEPEALQGCMDAAAARYDTASRLERLGDLPSAAQELACGADLLRQALAAPGVHSGIQQRLGKLLEHYTQCNTVLQCRKVANPSWLHSVVGLREAKRQLLVAVKIPIELPHLFTGNTKPWRGILLSGPPGTGKTSLARAVAQSVNLPFISVSCSDLIGKYLGESEQRVRDLFAGARQQAPCIIFLDEVDALLSRRGEGEHEAMRRVKNELLAAMDGFEQNERILVVGATNRPQDLDEAALRRFEKRLQIPLPETCDRAAIFEQKLLGLQHRFVPADYQHFAQLSDGYSGADIAIACKEAALAPILRLAESPYLAWDCFGRIGPAQAADPGAFASPASLSELGNVPMQCEVTREDLAGAIVRTQQAPLPR